jgi:hypothetical protein
MIVFENIIIIYMIYEWIDKTLAYVLFMGCMGLRRLSHKMRLFIRLRMLLIEINEGIRQLRALIQMGH